MNLIKRIFCYKELEENMNDYARRIKILECNHSNTFFRLLNFNNDPIYEEVCRFCGSELGVIREIVYLERQYNEYKRKLNLKRAEIRGNSCEK